MCDLHHLRFAVQSIEEIARQVQVAPSEADWDEWYVKHTLARREVFVYPGVFPDVVRAALMDARDEHLRARVMRFSLSMPLFCFKSLNGRSPDFSSLMDRKKFLRILEMITENIVETIEREKSRVRTPLVFSISCQDVFLPILDDVVQAMLPFAGQIKGVDLTNEQLHRSPLFYRPYVDKLREAGMSVLTL